MKKVQIGDSFQIPAVDYNAFVDATASFRSGQLDGGASIVSSPSRHTVKVLNSRFFGVGQYGVLGFRNVLFPPDTAAANSIWSDQPILEADTYNPEIHDAFIILQETIEKDSIGTGLVQGITPARVIVKDVLHKYAVPQPGFVDLMKTAATGTARILWQKSKKLGAASWMLLELGSSAPVVFPINLLRVGGVGGDASNPASWTYDVTDALTGAALASNQNPTTDPHRFARPLGQAAFADFGYAHFNEQKELAIGWINETTAGGGGTGSVFPITLSNPTGSTGSPTDFASLKYTVTNTLTGAELGTLVDPTKFPNKFRRTRGKKDPATFGYAHLNDQGAGVIGWINELDISSTSRIFPIRLLEGGGLPGGSGSVSSAANFRYEVRDAGTNILLASDINPSDSPHTFRRPVGRMLRGTAGMAYVTSSGSLVVTWVNEIQSTKACQ